MTSRLRTLLVLLILSASVWTFREVVGFGSVPLADDDTNIFFNPHLSNPDGPTLRWMFTNLDYVHRYMPMGWFGFSVVYGFSGLDPSGYHAADILLHALNAWLLFLLIHRLLQRFRPDDPEADRLLAAAAAALLWAVHPLRAETVAWCSGLLYSQALFFALLAVHARLSELEARARGRSPTGWLFLGFLAYAASVLTYPVALFLPPALLIVDVAWLGRIRWKSLLPGYLAWSAVAGASIAMNIVARYTVRAYLLPSSLKDFGILPRTLQAFYVCALYVGKTLWPPSILRMAGSTIFDLDPSGAFWWLCAAVVLALSLGAWALRRKAPFVGLGWLAYLVLLFPNLGFLEHPHTASDRYSYLPGCAFSVILAFALLRLTPRIRPFAWAACLAAAAALSVLAFRQARVWRNAEAYFSAVLAGSQSDDIRQITVSRMALLHFFRGDVRDGRAGAWDELKRAPKIGGVILTWKQMAPAKPLPADVAVRPLQEWAAAPWAVLHLEIALNKVKDGRLEDGLAHLNSALALSPDYSDARFTRGLVLANLGRTEAVHDWLIFRNESHADDRGRTAYLASKLRALLESRGQPVPRALAGPSP